MRKNIFLYIKSWKVTTIFIVNLPTFVILKNNNINYRFALYVCRKFSNKFFSILQNKNPVLILNFIFYKPSAIAEIVSNNFLFFLI